jgi:hypothetical protein
MPRLNAPLIPGFKGSPRQPTSGSWCSRRPIQLYGWDSRSETWHGPNTLGDQTFPDKRLLQALRTAPGRSWYGGVTYCSPGEPSTRFFALVHDLFDCAIASIYCDESKAGPAEVLAVIPESRWPHLRDEFAFEFLAFARFLGSLGSGAELQVHDAITSAITEQRDSGSLVLSLSTGVWPRDRDLALSCCAEKIAVTLCRWLDECSASTEPPELQLSSPEAHPPSMTPGSTVMIAKRPCADSGGLGHRRR